MRFKKLGRAFLARLERGEEVVEALAAFCRRKRVGLARVEGIGALAGAELGFYSLKTKKYRTQKLRGAWEVAPLLGNVAGGAQNPRLHLHATLCNGRRCLAGHLVRGTVGATLEVFVTPLPGKAARKKDAATGLALLDL